MNVRITDIDGKKPSFVQWDVDRVLYIEGTDSQPCLHFANPMLTRAIVVEAEADGSRWECRVPNIILQTAAPIVISVFVQPDEGKTVLTDWVKVQPKLKPQDYTYEENIGYTNWVVKSAEAQAILDAIEDLRQEIADAAEEADNAADVAGAARDQAVAAADGIDESIATALAEAKASGEFDGRDGDPGDPGPKGDRGDDGISPDVSVTAITGGHRVTIVDADNTYVFDVMDGDNGDPGAKGDPGDDGFSPEVSVATITGGHRVTITDAQGAHTFDVMDGESGGSVEEVFWATYNSTTEAEVTAAVTAGKTVLCKISDEIFYLVSKAAIGPSGSAWIFASANQTSMRVTFVSGSYWNSISTKTIPSKTSDLTNDSGFVNASGAAAAAPVQSVNGQTGNVTVPSLPTGGTAGQVLTLMPGLLPGSDPLPTWSDPKTVVLDFTLDGRSLVRSGPAWNDIDAAISSGADTVVAHVTKNDGTELFAPLVYYDDTPGAWTAKFSASDGYDGLFYSIVSGEDVADTWYYNEWDINDDLTHLYDSKLDNNLGSSEAGKFLVVGSDGAVTTMTLATWQGGNY